MRKPILTARSFAAAMAMALAGVLMGSGPVAAQDGDPELGARVWRDLSNCGNCHGWAGDGVPDIAQENGADLRGSVITPELAFETIRCGRPGTRMPSFRRNTWSEIIPCYGMAQPLGGDLQPDRSESPLSDRFIEGLVAFLFRDIIGFGPVTREYCWSVFSEGNARCEAYPTETELEQAATAGDAEAPAEPTPAPAPGGVADHDG